MWVLAVDLMSKGLYDYNAALLAGAVNQVDDGQLASRKTRRRLDGKEGVERGCPSGEGGGD